MARFLPRLASSPPTHASRARQRPPKDFRQNIFELQPLEVRILMSFVAQMSAPPTGASSTDYAVDLYTTGGVASKWVVNWGDTNTSTYLASSLPNGVFPTPFAPTHQYANSGNFQISATATLSTNSLITSKTGFALSANFGTNTFQQSGKTNYVPYANSGNANGEAMALDTSGGSTNGDQYVASLYNGNRFAITRFTPPASAGALGGVVDLSWGNRGTLVLNQFGTGTETDTPLAITVSSDGSSVGIAGKATFSGTTKWAVALVNTGGSGSITWQDTNANGLPASGQANALLFDPNNSDVVIAGTNGTFMEAAAVSSTGSLDTLFGSSGLKIITGATSANSIIQTQDPNADINGVTYQNEFVLGGFTTYTVCGCGCGCGGGTTASDFTLVKLNENGSIDTRFGSNGIVRTNFGNILNSCCCGSPSFDSDYSLMEWEDSSSNWHLIAVGSTNAFGSDQFALARYNEPNGALDTSFGPNHNGLAVGPSGDAYSAALQGAGGYSSPVFDPNANIVAAGATAGDFLVGRFLNTGTNSGRLDTTFGNAGVFQTDFGTSSANASDLARSVAVETTFSGDDTPTDIILGGSTLTNSSNAQIALADYLPANSVSIATATGSPANVPAQPANGGQPAGAFSASMSAPQSGVNGSAYAVDLYTTNGTASQWVVVWGDGNSNTYLASGQPNGVFPVPFSPTHVYASAGSYAITATATLSTNSSITSKTALGLSANFGTNTFQQSGKTTYTPYGDSSNANGEAMTVDTFNGDIYVASLFDGNRMAVSRFLPPTSGSLGGTIDMSWGNRGTIVIPQFGTGTEVDVPFAIAIDESFDHDDMVVAGKATFGGVTGWAVADIELSGSSGIVSWQASHTQGLPLGQANAALITLDQPASDGDERVVVAGTDGIHMVAAAFLEDGDGTGIGRFDTNFGTSGIVTITGATSANSIIQTQDPNADINGVTYQNEFVLGGFTTYTVCGCGCGCGCGGGTTASDFTLVKLHEDGSIDTRFGSSGIVRTNFGNILNSCCCGSPSFDSDYSLMEWEDSSSNWHLIAVGSTNAFGSDQFALARYNEPNGALDTSFGPNHNGLAVGPSGDAYSAVLEGSGGFSSATVDPNATIVVAGASNNDFLVARFLNTGTNSGRLDTTFGNAGIFQTDFGNSSTNATDVARSVALETLSGDDTATDIIVAGSSYTNSNNAQMSLADYLTSDKVTIT